jgi:hypothetical protein
MPGVKSIYRKGKREIVKSRRAGEWERGRVGESDVGPGIRD